ncbi:hypothetical protein AB0D13_33285 [Streptomyces sp. NPDC048430]|uniref:hypothetical protein n=1 Tax=Streptomyces sp. NPDC048430 TaxID=3155388 RepID=UPI00343F4ED1
MAVLGARPYGLRDRCAHYRFLAEFEPLRHIAGGVRSILYYGAQGDAGLSKPEKTAAPV